MTDFTHLQSFIQGIVKEAVETALTQNMELSAQFSESKQKIVEPEILDADQAAEFLHLAKQTLYTLTCKKKVPFYKNGKKVLFKKHELQEWMDSGRQMIIDPRYQPVPSIKIRNRRR